MSAIYSIFYRNGKPVEKSTLERMGETLAHRGQDDRGIWHKENVGLGHNMRYNTPESVYADMPMSNADKTCFITAECRIDNRTELFKTFNIPQGQRPEIPDSYLILKAYEKWGQDCPKHLLGAFAFAIWDVREQQLFCARDHMGIKPFYYYVDEEVFVFGSGIGGLIELNNVPQKMNPLKIGDYLMGNFQDKGITFYRYIKRLPPAYMIKVGRETFEEIKYWELRFNHETAGKNLEEVAAECASIFKEAVRCRIRGRGNLGALLSGGLDSSSIVCSLKGEMNECDLHTFSFIFPDKESDERKYINEVKSRVPIDRAHCIKATEHTPFDVLKNSKGDCSEPLGVPNMYLFTPAFQKAEDNDINVLLDGFDGDSIISHGRKIFTELFLKGRWRTLHKRVKEETLTSSKNEIEFYKHHVLYPLLFRPFYQMRKLKYRINDIPHQVLESPIPKGYRVLNEEFVRDYQLQERNYRLNIKNLKARNTTAHYHKFRMNNGLLTYGLEEWNRWAAGYGLECRYPFFDKRLMEFVYGVSGLQQRRAGYGRYYFRLAMKNTLPESIQWRTTKADLSPNFMRGISQPTSHAIIKENLNNLHDFLSNFVNLEEVETCFKSFKNTQQSDKAKLLWHFVAINTWLRREN
jgi:asparagine synthase (glutamine-hydrolysing)